MYISIHSLGELCVQRLHLWTSRGVMSWEMYRRNNSKGLMSACVRVKLYIYNSAPELNVESELNVSHV